MMLSQKPSNPQSLANMHMAWPKPGEKSPKKMENVIKKHTMFRMQHGLRTAAMDMVGATKHRPL